VQFISCRAAPRPVAAIRATRLVANALAVVGEATFDLASARALSRVADPYRLCRPRASRAGTSVHENVVGTGVTRLTPLGTERARRCMSSSQENDDAATDARAHRKVLERDNDHAAEPRARGPVAVGRRRVAAPVHA
jgi:hypothetical protein